jgi:hypothetical protein
MRNKSSNIGQCISRDVNHTASSKSSNSASFCLDLLGFAEVVLALLLLVDLELAKHNDQTHIVLEDHLPEHWNRPNRRRH